MLNKVAFVDFKGGGIATIAPLVQRNCSYCWRILNGCTSSMFTKPCQLPVTDDSNTGNHSANGHHLERLRSRCTDLDAFRAPHQRCLTENALTFCFSDHNSTTKFVSVSACVIKNSSLNTQAGHNQEVRLKSFKCSVYMA